MTGPLTGIKAVEWAAHANGPLIGVILGDMGAEIIKIEQRGVGDPNRGMVSMYGTRMRLHNGINAGFENVNRNKKSISLDLRKEQGKEIAYKLIEKADVFYTNYGQVSAAKVGLDYPALSKVNSRLVYANATSYGARGPERNQRAFDTDAQARSGLMTSLGERDTPPSLIVGAPLDSLGATIAAMGIMAALIARQQDGLGQMTNTSLLSGAIWLQLFNIQTALLRGATRAHLGMARHSRTEPKNPMSNQYQCADGKWLLLGEGQFDRFWPNFCHVMDLNEKEYTEMKINDLRKSKTISKLVKKLDSIFISRSCDEWIAQFKSKGAEFGYSKVNNVDALLTDPQVMINNYFVDFHHPVAGKIKLVNCPVEFSRTPASIQSAAPEFSQHTEELLLGLGYNWEEVANLKTYEVI